jgi:hypothetical protein
MSVLKTLFGEARSTATPHQPTSTIPKSDVWGAIKYVYDYAASAFQPLDTELTALASTTSAADKLPYFTGSGTATTTDLTAAARTVLDDATTAAMLTTLGAQPVDAELTAIAGLTSAADKVPYFTGSGTAAVGDFPAYGRSIAATASEAAFKALVNLEIGTDVQAYDADLTTWAGLTPSANAQSLVTAADYAAMRALLDLEVGTDVQAYSAALAAYPDPTANDADALGTVAASWSDLFLASGGVVNWANSTLTAAHASGVFSGSDSLVVTTGASGGGLEIISTNTGASGAYLSLYANSSSPAANDDAGVIVFGGKDSAGNATDYGYFWHEIVDPTNGAEESRYVWSLMSGGVAGQYMILADDGLTVGSNKVLTGGRHTIWVPAAAMVARTTNGAATGTTELATNDVMLKTFDFDTTTEEGVQFMISMPKSWDEGTVTFVPHWTAASGSGGVVWALAGIAFSNDDAMDTAYGTIQTSTDTLLTANDNHAGPESAAITIGGSPAAEDLVSFQVTREVADGSDTIAVDAKLIGIKLFYTVNAATDT